MDTPLYLYGYECTNFMRVEAFAVTPEGKSLIIRGDNFQGKSSFIDGVYDCLAGTDSKERPNPIHEGADRATLKLELQNDAGEIEYIVTKVYTPSGPRLEITLPDGSTIPRGKNLLDSFLSSYSLDPVEFLNRRPQDQIDDILQVCGIKPPLAQVKAITGTDHPAKPGESADTYLQRLSADETGVYFVERLRIGREVTALNGAIQKQADEIARHKETIGVTRPVEEIQAELDAIRPKQEEYLQARQATEEARLRKDDTQRTFQSALDKVIAAEKEVERLQKALVAAKEVAEDAKVELENATFDRDDAATQHATATVISAAHPDHTCTIKGLEAEHAAASRNIKQTTIVEQAAKRLDELKAQYQQKSEEHARSDSVLTDLRALRKSLLEGIDLGVDHLSVIDGILYYKGQPFKQASKAEEITVACAVSMRRKPRLRLLRVDNGESLGKEAREKLLSLAAENGWQVIMACVADNKGLKVEIVEKGA